LTLDRPHVRGGGTKAALSHSANISSVNLSAILQYDPSEFTFTALAGTPLIEIADVLDNQNQFLPFDPPFAQAGATLGGTVAAGLSGAGRFRYGGVRDFLLGVRMVTTAGRIVFGGGKVVKNAAGFDIPKLMVGSLGRFGMLVELTFKVFPKPQAFATAFIDFASTDEAIAAFTDLGRRPLDLTCLDMEPPSRIWVCLAGSHDALPARFARVAQITRGNLVVLDDPSYWPNLNEFHWLPSSHDLIKIPISPTQVALAESIINQFERPIPRRYSIGGNLLWLGWPSGDSVTKLAGICLRLHQCALAVTGRWANPIIGQKPSNPFLERLSAAFHDQPYRAPG
jgi:glycolate oxidase FAD binding subunit